MVVSDDSVILEAELTLILDDEDGKLKAGDVVIQRGTNHGWRDVSDKPRILFVLLDGVYDEELNQVLRDQRKRVSANWIVSEVILGGLAYGTGIQSRA